MFGIVPAAAGTPDKIGVFYCGYYGGTTGYILNNCGGANVHAGTTCAVGDGPEPRASRESKKVDLEANTLQSVRGAFQPSALKSAKTGPLTPAV